MKITAFTKIVEALNEAEVRFIVVGGLAVIAHGYLRVTRDADLVIELVPESIRRTFQALEAIGYKPTVPITAAQFADADLRRQWREEKNMRVLQFWSDAHPGTKLDVFIEHPFNFEAEWKAALIEKTGERAAETRIATIPTLIQMKESAARPQDLIDIEFLRKIQNELHL
ncbi:MAG: hypothetical protein GVY36_02050 [Verrucomicrobia bacterium]|jgi:hypothetical protein|nr:hypothetical protein [Verrucomicrobiota bacterium]